MVVVARTDPHAAHQDVFDAHPDWIAVDAAGQKRRHPVMPELWVTCALGPYNFEFMTEVTKEIVSLATRSTACSATAGRARACATASTAARISQGGGGAGSAAHERSAGRRAARLYRVAAGAAIRTVAAVGRGDSAINPAACYIPNTGGGALSDLDMKTSASSRPSCSPTGRRAAG
jgi:hypothetical protein